jgi:hypothetical protein
MHIRLSLQAFIIVFFCTLAGIHAPSDFLA